MPAPRPVLPGLMAILLFVLALLSGCSSDVSTGGGGAGTGGDSGGGGGGAKPALGLNDVTFLLPLPSSADPVLFRASDVATNGEVLLPQALVEQVLTIPDHPNAITVPYDTLQLVGVRFDLCDRAAAGPCPSSEDARFRLVFQPIQDGQAADVGFHVFYTVPKTEVPAIVASLRELAGLRSLPIDSPLQVSSALATDAAYKNKLRALLADACSASRVVRVTVMGQELMFASFRWIFHGIEKRGGSFQEIAIPGAQSSVQEVQLLGMVSYELTPAVDAPAGLAVAISQPAFAAANADERAAALDALAQADNPLLTVPNTIQCAACHVSTVVLAARADESGLDPNATDGHYTSAFNGSVEGGTSASEDVLLRGLGYRGTSVAISQRVVNETAQVLTEIAALP